MKKLKKITKEEVRAKNKKLFTEFIEFISRGNVVDLAVGVVIGSSFSKIVSSMVDDIIMPIVGVILGGYDFSTLSISNGSAYIKYGLFIQNIINFLIIGFFVFLLAKLLNAIFNRKKEEVSVAKVEPKKSDEVLLLEEIRDLLKKSK